MAERVVPARQGGVERGVQARDRLAVDEGEPPAVPLRLGEGRELPAELSDVAAVYRTQTC